jgi:hypothetical protein
MAMTRTERRASHKKQNRLKIMEGAPRAVDLTEGEPEIRLTEEGLVEYVNFRGILYKNIFTRDT